MGYGGRLSLGAPPPPMKELLPLSFLSPISKFSKKFLPKGNRGMVGGEELLSGAVSGRCFHMEHRLYFHQDS